MSRVCQCSSMGTMSSVRSRYVNPVKPPVCVESTAVGRPEHSMPTDEMIGMATVSEHLPTQDMSWIARILS